MTYKELKQIADINKEIEFLKREIENAEFRVEHGMVSDVVSASSQCFPYTKYAAKVTGIDIKGYDRKVKRLKNTYKKRVNKLLDRTEEANKYIESIEDSETRLILQAKFIKDLTWPEVEEETGINERTARRKFKKWWNENS